MPKEAKRRAFVAGEFGIFIEEPLGQGQFSKVFPATRVAAPAPRGKEEFAAKYSELKDAAARDRFNDEANTLVRINEKFATPYIVRLVKRFMTRGGGGGGGSSSTSTPSGGAESFQKGILIFRNIRGPTLHKLLLVPESHDKASPNTAPPPPLPPHVVQRFFAQMVDALACTHACDVLHRDLKPSNWMLTVPIPPAPPAAAADRIKCMETADVILIDFGFAARREGREPCGSPMFMSPECMMGNVHGPPTDIFALGVTLLCMIFGVRRSNTNQVASPSVTSSATSSSDTDVDRQERERRSHDGAQAAAAATTATAVPLKVNLTLNPDDNSDSNIVLACFPAASPENLALPRTEMNPHLVRQIIPDETHPYFHVRYVIEACLETDPRRRPTATQLRNVPWVKEAGLEPPKRASQANAPTAASSASSVASLFAVGADGVLAGEGTGGGGGGGGDELKRKQNIGSNAKTGAPSSSSSPAGVAPVSNHTDAAADLPSESKSAVVVSVASGSEFVEQASSSPTNADLSKNNNNNNQVGADASESASSLPSSPAVADTPTTAAATEIQKNRTSSENDNEPATLFRKMDGTIDERIRALLACAHAQLVPANRAAICSRVARLLCEKSEKMANEQKELRRRRKTRQQQEQEGVETGKAAVTKSEAAATTTTAVAADVTANLSPAAAGDAVILTEQLHWINAQLSSMSNVLPRSAPLPEFDAVVADSVRIMASSALRAILVHHRECAHGPCDLVLLHVRVALTTELAHFKELDSLRKKLEVFCASSQKVVEVQ